MAGKCWLDKGCVSKAQAACIALYVESSLILRGRGVSINGEGNISHGSVDENPIEYVNTYHIGGAKEQPKDKTEICPNNLN